jgi:hypothetical protein
MRWTLGILVLFFVALAFSTTTAVVIARSQANDAERPVQQLAGLEQRDIEHTVALRRLEEENRIQNGHNVNSSRALLRAAAIELQAGRTESARVLAIHGMNGMIGLFHHPCGGEQTIQVPGVHIPADLRQFFGDGDPYTITSTSGAGADEQVRIRVNAAATC